MINFLEFVCTLWNILTLPQSDFGSVAYLLRDPSGKQNITCKYLNFRIRNFLVNLFFFSSVHDVRVVLEMLHNKKIDRDPAIFAIFNKMKRDLETKLSIYEFNKWTAANPSVVAPVLMLQLHLRLQIIGESFWSKLSKERSKHVEQSRLDYVHKLQIYVLEKNKLFQSKIMRELEQKKRETTDKNKENIARKESALLGYFNMKPQSKKALSRVIPSQRLDLETPKHPADEYYDDKLIYEKEVLKTPITKSRGNSTDEPNTVSNSKSNSSGKSKKDVLGPVTFKYDADTDVLNLSPDTRKGRKGYQKSNRISEEDKETTIPDYEEDTKIRSKVSEKKSSEKESPLPMLTSPSKKKKKHKEYKELVSGGGGGGMKKQISVFDIFDPKNKKFNFDILDEDEIEKELVIDQPDHDGKPSTQQSSPGDGGNNTTNTSNNNNNDSKEQKKKKKDKAAVPVRKRRSSLMRKPNLLVRGE
jgi:hypothetical protein